MSGMPQLYSRLPPAVPKHPRVIQENAATRFVNVQMICVFFPVGRQRKFTYAATNIA